MTTAHAGLLYENVHNFAHNNAISGIMPLATLTIPWSEQNVNEKVTFPFFLSACQNNQLALDGFHRDP